MGNLCGASSGPGPGSGKYTLRRSTKAQGPARRAQVGFLTTCCFVDEGEFLICQAAAGAAFEADVLPVRRGGGGVGRHDRPITTPVANRQVLKAARTELTKSIENPFWL
jgi:hypothetical protein